MGTLNVYSVERKAETVTTGATGNIATDYVNSGHHYILAAFSSDTGVFLRTWISTTNNHWYFTAIDPNSGETVNNTTMNIRYLVVYLRNI